MLALFVVLLLAWGNAVPLLFAATARLPGGSWPFVGAGIALAVVALLVARSLGLDARASGLAPDDARQGAALGALAAAMVGVVGVGTLNVAGLVVGVPIDYTPVAQLPASALALHVAFFLPLGVVVPEELAFRGVVLGALRARGDRVAVLASAALFAFWHVSVVAATVAETTVAPPSPWAWPAMAGALAVVFAGGVVLAGLRLLTGTLTASIAAHWTFNVVVLVGLWIARA